MDLWKKKGYAEKDLDDLVSSPKTYFTHVHHLLLFHQDGGFLLLSPRLDPSRLFAQLSFRLAKPVCDEESPAAPKPPLLAFFKCFQLPGPRRTARIGSLSHLRLPTTTSPTSGTSSGDHFQPPTSLSGDALRSGPRRVGDSNRARNGLQETGGTLVREEVTISIVCTRVVIDASCACLDQESH